MMFLLSQILVWLLIVYGITQIIADAHIFEGTRVFLTSRKNPILKFTGELISCFLCASVWVSFLVGHFVWSPTAQFFNSEFQFLLDGMFGSCAVWFIRGLENKLYR